jgi:hypothetical protein
MSAAARRWDVSAVREYRGCLKRIASHHGRYANPNSEPAHLLPAV